MTLQFDATIATFRAREAIMVTVSLMFKSLSTRDLRRVNFRDLGEVESNERCAEQSLVSAQSQQLRRCCSLLLFCCAWNAVLALATVQKMLQGRSSEDAQRPRLFYLYGYLAEVLLLLHINIDSFSLLRKRISR